MRSTEFPSSFVCEHMVTHERVNTPNMVGMGKG